MSVSISRSRAYTAIALQMPTHELAEGSQPGESLWGLQMTDENQLVAFSGSYPLEVDGELVGIVDVSGGEMSGDMAVVSVAVKRLEELIE